MGTTSSGTTKAERDAKLKSQGYQDYGSDWLGSYTSDIAANESDSDPLNDKSLSATGDFKYLGSDLPEFMYDQTNPATGKWIGADGNYVYGDAGKYMNEVYNPGQASARSNYDAANKAISDYTGRRSALAGANDAAAPGLSALKAAQDRASRRMKFLDSGARRIYPTNAGA